MARENAKTTFTKQEYLEIRDLITKLERADSQEQKKIRKKIRKIGLHWSEIPQKMQYTVKNFDYLFHIKYLEISGNSVSQTYTRNAAPLPISTYTPDKKEYKGRATSDESYVIDLCDEVLKMKARRQHKFDFLVGDTGRKLPVDAYYESLNLVIEYHERQHTEAVSLFDNKPTVSGVSRGEQRKIYDQRRAEILPKHGIKLVIISYRDFGTSKKLQRNRNNDILVVKTLLKI